jgi:hypothetical protein
MPGVSFRGRVVSFAPATGAQFSVIPLENATGNFTKIIQRVPVRIELEGVDAELGKLRPGLSVAVRVDRRHSFTLHQAQNEVTAPNRCLHIRSVRTVSAAPLAITPSTAARHLRSRSWLGISSLFDIQIVSPSIQEIGGACRRARTS